MKETVRLKELGEGSPRIELDERTLKILKLVGALLHMSLREKGEIAKVI